MIAILPDLIIYVTFAVAWLVADWKFPKSSSWDFDCPVDNVIYVLAWLVGWRVSPTGGA